MAVAATTGPPIPSIPSGTGTQKGNKPSRRSSTTLSGRLFDDLDVRGPLAPRVLAALCDRLSDPWDRALVAGEIAVMLQANRRNVQLVLAALDGLVDRERPSSGDAYRYGIADPPEGQVGLPPAILNWSALVELRMGACFSHHQIAAALAASIRLDYRGRGASPAEIRASGGLLSRHGWDKRLLGRLRPVERRYIRSVKRMGAWNADPRVRGRYGARIRWAIDRARGERRLSTCSTKRDYPGREPVDQASGAAPQERMGAPKTARGPPEWAIEGARLEVQSRIGRGYRVDYPAALGREIVACYAELPHGDHVGGCGLARARADQVDNEWHRYGRLELPAIEALELLEDLELEDLRDPGSPAEIWAETVDYLLESGLTAREIVAAGWLVFGSHRGGIGSPPPECPPTAATAAGSRAGAA